MKRSDVIKDILGRDKNVEIVPRVNDRAKMFINKLLGREIFNLESVRPSQLDLHKDYTDIFNIESEKVKRVMYDLAEQSGFFKVNIKVDPVQEGRRSLFIYILGRITKEPVTPKEKG